MRRLPLPLIVLALALALLAASCGGGGKASPSSTKNAAVVAGTPISQGELDARMQQAKCSYKLQKRTFPSAGTPDYQSIQQEILGTLIQEIEFSQEAPKVGVSVSAKQVDDQLTALKKQYFNGSDKRYQEELKRQCTTDAEVRSDLRARLLSQAIYNKVTAKVTVGPTEEKSYYDSHKQSYTQPESRLVRHILVKTKALADKLYAELKAGASFAALAKKYSQDPSSKNQGGRLTVSKGQTVPEFDRTAFSLKTGQLAKPVHNAQYGWFIIQALKPIVPAKVTPYAQVEQSIRQQLLQQKRTTFIEQWLAGVTKQYAKKITYTPGFAPTTTTTTSPTTTG